MAPAPPSPSPSPPSRPAVPAVALGERQLNNSSHDRNHHLNSSAQKLPSKRKRSAWRSSSQHQPGGDSRRPTLPVIDISNVREPTLPVIDISNVSGVALVNHANANGSTAAATAQESNLGAHGNTNPTQLELLQTLTKERQERSAEMASYHSLAQSLTQSLSSALSDNATLRQLLADRDEEQLLFETNLAVCGDAQDILRQRQQYLLGLHHARSCNIAAPSNCAAEYCGRYKELLRHVGTCTSAACSLQQCRTCRALLHHTERCSRDAACPLCEPLREVVRQEETAAATMGENGGGGGRAESAAPGTPPPAGGGQEGQEMQIEQIEQQHSGIQQQQQQQPRIQQPQYHPTPAVTGRTHVPPPLMNKTPAQRRVPSPPTQVNPSRPSTESLVSRGTKKPSIIYTPIRQRRQGSVDMSLLSRTRRRRDSDSLSDSISRARFAQQLQSRDERSVDSEASSPIDTSGSSDEGYGEINSVEVLSCKACWDCGPSIHKCEECEVSNLSLLLHTSACQDGQCTAIRCGDMKMRLRHVETCETGFGEGCRACRYIVPLLRLHSRQCRLEKCPIPYCASLKKCANCNFDVSVSNSDPASRPCLCEICQAILPPALLHSTTCCAGSECDFPRCDQMSSHVAHWIACPDGPQCHICRRYTAIVRAHAMDCQDSKCKIISCPAAKASRQRRQGSVDMSLLSRTRRRRDSDSLSDSISRARFAQQLQSRDERSVDSEASSPIDTSGSSDEGYGEINSVEVLSCEACCGPSDNTVLAAQGPYAAYPREVSRSNVLSSQHSLPMLEHDAVIADRHRSVGPAAASNKAVPAHASAHASATTADPPAQAYLDAEAVGRTRLLREKLSETQKIRYRRETREAEQEEAEETKKEKRRKKDREQITKDSSEDDIKTAFAALGLESPPNGKWSKNNLEFAHKLLLETNNDSSANKDKSWLNHQAQAVRTYQDGGGKQRDTTIWKARCLISRGVKAAKVKGSHDENFDVIVKELCEFKRREGHCNPAERSKDEKKLARAVRDFRSQYRKQTLTAERIARLEGIGLDFVTERTKKPNNSGRPESGGRSGISLITGHNSTDTGGSAAAADAAATTGFGLAAAAGAVATATKETGDSNGEDGASGNGGALEPIVQITKDSSEDDIKTAFAALGLESPPNGKWSKNNLEFAHKLLLETNNDSSANKDKSWLNHQAQAVRTYQDGGGKQRDTTIWKARCLISRGVKAAKVKGSHDENFDVIVKELCEFKRREGHCNPAERSKDEKKLARAVRDFRSQYRKQTLTAERIARLEGIGLDFVTERTKKPNVSSGPSKTSEASEASGTCTTATNSETQLSGERAPTCAIQEDRSAHRRFRRLGAGLLAMGVDPSTISVEDQTADDVNGTTVGTVGASTPTGTNVVAGASSSASALASSRPSYVGDALAATTTTAMAATTAMGATHNGTSTSESTSSTCVTGIDVHVTNTGGAKKTEPEPSFW